MAEAGGVRVPGGDYDAYVESHVRRLSTPARPGQSWRSCSQPTSWIVVYLRVSMRPCSPSSVAWRVIVVSWKSLAFCSAAKSLTSSCSVGARQHGKQAQEQDLVERIDDLAGLPMVLHIFEIGEKNRRLGQRRACARRRVHRTILRPESEDVDRFSSNPFCHLLLRPIAQRISAPQMAKLR